MRALPFFDELLDMLELEPSVVLKRRALLGIAAEVRRRGGSGRWLRFEKYPENERKTSLWMVRALEGGACLGFVRWYGRWRCYAFAATSGAIFERDCLRTIATFCEKRTREHMDAARAARKAGR